MNPICRNIPDFATAACIAATSVSDSAGGFSQNVGFFRAAAAITSSRCVCVGLTITIASTAGSSIIASGST